MSFLEVGMRMAFAKPICLIRAKERTHIGYRQLLRESGI
jgi:hypothetical protein